MILWLALGGLCLAGVFGIYKPINERVDCYIPILLLAVSPIAPRQEARGGQVMLSA
jgi:hypothetical protein